jgi:hypothetical protein
VTCCHYWGCGRTPLIRLEAREGLFDDFQFLWSVERAINQLTSFRGSYFHSASFSNGPKF